MATDAPGYLETAVQNTSPHEGHDLAGMIRQDDIAAPDGETGAQADVQEDAPKEFVPIDLQNFLIRWNSLHVMGGFHLSVTLGAPCPLGDLARDEGGQEAGKAFYDLCMTSKTTQKMFLSQEMGLLGQIMIVGMHGKACLSIVKTAQQEGRMKREIERQNVEFATRRAQEAA